MDQEALYALLCTQKPWIFHPAGHFYISFRSDGTGELTGFEYLHWMMCAKFIWRRLPLSPIDTTKNATNPPQHPEIKVVGQVKLEITLLKELPSTVGCSDPAWLDKWTREEEYVPTEFVVTIERGRFVTDAYRINASRRAKGEDVYYWDERDLYGLRLCFDQSPYPRARTAGFVEYLKPEDTNYRNAVGNWIGRFGMRDGGRGGRAMNDFGVEEKGDGEEGRCVVV